MRLLQNVFRRVRAALGGEEAALQDQRRRIAADLHDGPLQSVIALEMRLAAARSLAGRDPDAALRELGELAGMANAVVAELRAFQRTLSPPPLELNDLATLAHRLVEDFGAASGLQTLFQAPGGPMLAPPEVCLELTQILREALANVRKHARARTVKVTVADRAALVIEDDGAGFPVVGKFNLAELEALGAGPRSIIERVRNLGGELKLESWPEQGSRLEIRVPL